MAWQRPNCIVQAVQTVRAAQLQSILRTSTVTSGSLLQQRKGTRSYATEAQTTGGNALQVRAASEIDFSQLATRPARVIPASPAYFSGSPKFIDHLLNLERVCAKYASLPTVAPNEAPRMAWLKLAQFRDFVGEPVPTKKYKSLVKILQRLNRIEPALVPGEVRDTLKTFLRPGNPYGNKPAPATVDEMGRARGKGKRKTSSAVVYLVEGEGEVMVNGKTLVEAFPRLHDRESATWPLRCTSRLDKYNVWATVRGGGVTGQAEAITLALARALLVHEPALKPILRKGTLQMRLSEWVVKNIADNFSSWCHYRRCSSRREKESRSRQGSQDANLGQEMKACLFSLGPGVLSALYSVYCSHFPDLYHYLTCHLDSSLNMLSDPPHHRACVMGVCFKTRHLHGRSRRQAMYLSLTLIGRYPQMTMESID